jgi:hypothetical protein
VVHSFASQGELRQARPLACSLFLADKGGKLTVEGITHVCEGPGRGMLEPLFAWFICQECMPGLVREGWWWWWCGVWGEALCCGPRDLALWMAALAPIPSTLIPAVMRPTPQFFRSIVLLARGCEAAERGAS